MGELGQVAASDVLLTQANSLSSNATCFPQSAEVLVHFGGLGAQTLWYVKLGFVIAVANIEHMGARHLGKHVVCLSSGPPTAL